MQNYAKLLNFILVFLLAHILHCSRHPSPKVLSYHVVAEYPHDHSAFTQGLEHDRLCNNTTQECLDVFWESTGLYGQSSVRQTAVMNGEVLMRTDMAAQHFGEGLTRMNDTLYQISWKSGLCFKYSVKDLSLIGSFHTGLSDGWGLTNDGRYLIITDSSHTIYWVDPESLQTVRRVAVKDGDHELPWLNELELINGELWGNIWQTECIARVDLTTGQVTHWMLMHGLREKLLHRQGTKKNMMDVLNGIAWDPHGKRLFVTGKQWPAIFEVLPLEFTAGRAPSLAQVRSRCWPRQ
ncbi:hypothetical protein CEUSTIGMA_g11398.t1 [Chlamydomonas eustigma]|uniref:Glutamine cyclotransferase n=1 Tax=Chlamydomonas eustigma TaxID=1157962 RepID=A0A250XLM6_9CHLO|nr:hypothetical protein CEUSTIGMA_g11398.t1 [Chlamydomonas eustigma]|eukprot:GAX83974.1 hypothetical protein CEUSTIGMA_g11398.t1 [Chlamydomonas eustigma]